MTRHDREVAIDADGNQLTDDQGRPIYVDQLRYDEETQTYSYVEDDPESEHEQDNYDPEYGGYQDPENNNYPTPGYNEVSNTPDNSQTAYRGSSRPFNNISANPGRVTGNAPESSAWENDLNTIPGDDPFGESAATSTLNNTKQTRKRGKLAKERVVRGKSSRPINPAMLLLPLLLLGGGAWYYMTQMRPAGIETPSTPATPVTEQPFINPTTDNPEQTGSQAEDPLTPSDDPFASEAPSSNTQESTDAFGNPIDQPVAESSTALNNPGQQESGSNGQKTSENTDAQQSTNKGATETSKPAKTSKKEQDQAISSLAQQKDPYQHAFKSRQREESDNMSNLKSSREAAARGEVRNLPGSQEGTASNSPTQATTNTRNVQSAPPITIRTVPSAPINSTVPSWSTIQPNSRTPVQAPVQVPVQTAPSSRPSTPTVVVTAPRTPSTPPMVVSPPRASAAPTPYSPGTYSQNPTNTGQKETRPTTTPVKPASAIDQWIADNNISYIGLAESDGNKEAILGSSYGAQPVSVGATVPGTRVIVVSADATSAVLSMDGVKQKVILGGNQ